MGHCWEEVPRLEKVGDDHCVACFNFARLEGGSG
jgi:hypothetical protein